MSSRGGSPQNPPLICFFAVAAGAAVGLSLLLNDDGEGANATGLLYFDVGLFGGLVGFFVSSFLRYSAFFRHSGLDRHYDEITGAIMIGYAAVGIVTFVAAVLRILFFSFCLLWFGHGAASSTTSS
jgi:hypothetical protein